MSSPPNERVDLTTRPPPQRGKLVHAARHGGHGWLRRLRSRSFAKPLGGVTALFQRMIHPLPLGKPDRGVMLNTASEGAAWDIAGRQDRRSRPTRAPGLEPGGSVKAPHG